MSDEAARSEPTLRLLHRSRVGEDEIDELGHLSVPFYEQRAQEASEALLARHGLMRDELNARGVEPTRVDGFTRNYREQFLGAPLEVRGGVIDVRNDEIWLYHELVNTEREELSAVFVHRFVLQAGVSRRPAKLDNGVRESLIRDRVAWPEHGQPRSLDLSRSPFRLELAEAEQRALATRAPRRIEAEECTPAGFLEPSRAQHLPYTGTSVVDDPSMQWVFESPDGIRLGLADLESRNTLLSLPRLGERIQVFSADVEIARKVIRRSHWVFDVDSRELLTAGSVVMALLDLDARRTVEISGALRAMFDRRYHPDLA